MTIGMFLRIIDSEQLIILCSYQHKISNQFYPFLWAKSVLIKLRINFFTGMVNLEFTYMAAEQFYIRS